MGPPSAVTRPVPQVTTFSRLLSNPDLAELALELQDWAPRLCLLSLQEFDTECSFLREVR